MKSQRCSLLLLGLFGLLTFFCWSWTAGRTDRTESFQRPQAVAKSACHEFSPQLLAAIRAANEHPLPRRPWTADVCEGEGAAECAPAFRSVARHQHYWVTSKLRVLECSIAKNMSQLLRAVFCFLQDELGFFYAGRSLVRDVFNRACSDDLHRSFAEAVRQHGVDTTADWRLLAVVREPVDRFLSSFLYLCVVGAHEKDGSCRRECHGCGFNLTCYLERQFEKFERLAAHPLEYSGLNVDHSYPQTWRCNFDTHLQNYTLLRYAADSAAFFDAQLRPFLAERRASGRALEFVRAAITAERTAHSTSSLEIRGFFERRLRSSSYLLGLVVRSFYHDFRVFSFDLPPVPEE